MAGAEAAGLPFKKKSLHAPKRDPEGNRKRRREFVQVLGDIAPEKLIFLDENGVSTQMTRRYARARGGARIAEGTPPSSPRSGHHRPAATAHGRGCDGLVQTPICYSTDIGEML